MTEPVIVSPPPIARLSFWHAVATMFQTVGRYWKTCLVVSLAYAVLSGAINAVSRTSTGVVDPTTVSPSAVAAAGAAALATLAALVLVNVFVAPVTLGGLSLVGSAAVYGDAIDTKGIVRRSFDRALEAIAAALIIGLILLVGPILVGLVAVVFGVAGSPETGFGVLVFGVVALILPLLYVFVRLSLGVPVVMREGRGPIEALRRSWHLVGGAWWRVCALVVPALLLFFFIAFGSFRSFVGQDSTTDFILGFVLTTIGALVAVTLLGVAYGTAYAMCEPEDVVPPEVAASEARVADPETDLDVANAPAPVAEDVPPPPAPPGTDEPTNDPTNEQTSGP